MHVAGLYENVSAFGPIQNVMCGFAMFLNSKYVHIYDTFTRFVTALPGIMYSKLMRHFVCSLSFDTLSTLPLVLI